MWFCFCSGVHFYFFYFSGRSPCFFYWKEFLPLFYSTSPSIFKKPFLPISSPASGKIQIMFCYHYIKLQCVCLYHFTIWLTYFLWFLFVFWLCFLMYDSLVFLFLCICEFCFLFCVVFSLFGAYLMIGASLCGVHAFTCLCVSHCTQDLWLSLPQCLI